MQLLNFTPTAEERAYERELSQLKPYDSVQFSENVRGYQFITTAGHGYLVVPRNDERAKEAEALCKYGFRGTLALYLEEDCEAPAFLKK